MVVTGAFNFSGAGLAAARDEVFALVAVAVGAFFGVAAAVFVTALLGVFVLLAAAAFFTAGLAIDLLEAGLVAAGFAFFAVTVVFAGFFIAFAMESIPSRCSRAPRDCAWWSRLLTCFGIRPRDNLLTFRSSIYGWDASRFDSRNFVRP
ncbi:hypothetical protein [Noviherbaspirillum autotrophicum]|uniref:hypothetical protein n=1 Tax=Noviherbaspirillum autotrophicum TaxID=709839 RepID=UPI001E42FB75|nr:hypothetical protein [Noviherbaspirillum autotrophicum]